MPYPTEHAARMIDPDKFNSNSFRSKELTTGIRAIMGKLIGENTMTIQAYRFSKEDFTEEKAKKWLKEHKLKPVYFEKALETPLKESVNMTNDDLAHYGILGMKWGRRKSSSRNSKSKSGPDTSSADHKIAATIRKKKLHEMSNDEIRKLSERLELERRYKNLDPDKVARGKKQAKEIMTTMSAIAAATATITTLAAAGKKIYDFSKKVKADKLIKVGS